MSTSVPQEAAIEGRRRIAEHLSRVMGVPVSMKAVDRLSERRRNPLPMHGYPGRVWVFPSEVERWWASTDRSSAQLLAETETGKGGNAGKSIAGAT